MNQRRGGRRSQQHGLGAPARVKQAVGEDVAALGIGDELDFVDRQELDAAVERHGFDRAYPIGRVGGRDLLLAGDQRDMALAARLDDAIVDFARQQPERQADHARGVAEHPLDGEVGLAGIGRPENGDEPRRAPGESQVVHDADVLRSKSPTAREPADVGSGLANAPVA